MVLLHSAVRPEHCAASTCLSPLREASDLDVGRAANGGARHTGNDGLLAFSIGIVLLKSRELAPGSRANARYVECTVQ